MGSWDEADERGVSHYIILCSVMVGGWGEWWRRDSCIAEQTKIVIPLRPVLKGIPGFYYIISREDHRGERGRGLHGTQRGLLNFLLVASASFRRPPRMCIIVANITSCSTPSPPLVHSFFLSSLRGGSLV